MEQEYNWNTWLKRWNDLLLERLDQNELPYYPPNVVQAVKIGWLGFDAASEAEVQALEARLGKKLPPSYRQFLLTSNGFLQPGMLVPRLYPVHEVDHFIKIEKENLDFWLTWQAEDRENPFFDDTGAFLQHIQSLIIISEREVAGTAQYFLNPDRINEDGEWEAYYYADWNSPNAVQYGSFRELMEREFEFLHNYVD